MQDNEKKANNQAIRAVKLKIPIAELTKKDKQVFNYILNSFLHTCTPLHEYKEISSRHFRQNCVDQSRSKKKCNCKGLAAKKCDGKKCIVYRGKYEPSLQKLQRLGFIQTDHYHQFFVKKNKNGKYEKYKDGKCKSYRINPELLGGFLRIDDTKKSTRRNQDRLLQWTIKNLKNVSCSLSIHEIEATVNNIVTNEEIKGRFTPLEEIENGFYYFAFIGYQKSDNPVPKQKILDLANKKGLNALFCHNNRIVYIGDANEITELKKKGLRTVYKEVLANFATDRQAEFIGRSDTNKRLTTPFTIFPSSLLKYLRLEGQELVQYDIKNSQFCILANLILAYHQYYKNGLISPIIEKLKKQKYYYGAFKRSFNLLLDSNGCLQDNVLDFCECAINGNLYELIGDNTGMKRKEAKKAMFIVAFASRHYNPPTKQKTKEAFKDVISFIDSIKKELPPMDKICFAVLLQLIESYICIDNVLKSLKKHKIRTLTRHDSFCVKNSDSNNAKLIIESELNRILPFGYSLKKEL